MLHASTLVCFYYNDQIPEAGCFVTRFVSFFGDSRTLWGHWRSPCGDHRAPRWQEHIARRRNDEVRWEARCEMVRPEAGCGQVGGAGLPSIMVRATHRPLTAPSPPLPWLGLLPIGFCVLQILWLVKPSAPNMWAMAPALSCIMLCAAAVLLFRPFSHLIPAI